MRSALRTVLFSALTAGLCGSLSYAQHATGHASASAGFHSGGSANFHTGSSGVHTGSYAARFGYSGFSGVNSLPPPASGISPGAWRQIQRSNRSGYGRLPYGYLSAPYYYPFLGYGDTGYAGGYNDPPAEDPAAESTMMAEGALGAQIQRLSDEVHQLRDAQQRGAAPAEEAQHTPPPPPVTLVLRDGQHVQVENYAVMDQTFWDFTKDPARKIPIASIDLNASARATEASGGEFPQLSGAQ